MVAEDFDLSLRILAQQLQQISDLYATRFDINRDDIWYLGKLSEELGELNAAYFKLTGRGRKKDAGSEALRLQFEDEVADLFAHVMLFALRHNVNLADALARKWLIHRSDV